MNLRSANWLAERAPARGLAVAAVALALFGCSQKAVTVQLHPLQGNGDVSYVCRDVATGRGMPTSECNWGAVDRGERQLLALMTQTITGEVAVLKVPHNPLENTGEWFVDIDPTAPGWGFLRVGALPGDIATTPGGEATFVGVGEVGRPGLFGLPTSLLKAPASDQPPRDITSFPACSLPATPGEIQIALEPATASGEIFVGCSDRTLEVESSGDCDALVTDCPADLTREGGPRGRRKLIVALPDRGSIAVIDAQKLLDRAPGTFQPCELEVELPLRVDLPSGPITQVLPDDLKGPGAGCAPQTLPLPPPPAAYRARPTGLALGSDAKLYVGDGAAPVVHSIDLSNPCSPREEPPLITQSFDNYQRVVTTSRVAVSPVGPLSGKRFVYAIDEYDWPAGSVMAFDVSPDSVTRVPLVRPGLPEIPVESADRIRLAASPKDVAFLLRDRPQGSVGVGTACEPDPEKSDQPGAEYRPASDFSSGARPRELRGIFGAILLTNGQVTLVDVDDFDAACRRPRSTNPATVPDFRGCANDPTAEPYELPNTTTPTVTDEVSCNMVAPHRPRGNFLGVNSSTFGLHAPTLRAFPQLNLPESAGSRTFEQRPKLLGVDFPRPMPKNAEDVEPAKVYVGSLLYERKDGGSEPANELVIDPSRQVTQNSVVLPFEQPRAYAPTEDLALAYEGRLAGQRESGLFSQEGDSVVLTDFSISFCDIGVNDVELTAERLTALSGAAAPSGAALTALAREYSDYVVITSDFPVETDSYWASLGVDAALPSSHADCKAVFGAADAEALLATREFRIEAAEFQRLTLLPRAEARENWAAELLRCFPEASKYVVRASKQWILTGSASGFRHQLRSELVADKIVCRPDCDPRKRYFESRVFEMTTTPCPAGETCLEACATAATGVTLGGAGSACIHETPVARFAVYRGEEPSVRDMTFTWQVVGGFSTLKLDLGLVSSNVSPTRLVPLPQLDWVSVVDAGALGLAMFSLDTLSPLTPTLN